MERDPAASSVDPGMKRYYAQRAPHYDAVYDKPERAADIAFLRAWIPAQLAGRRVLEVACGTGYWTQHIIPVSMGVTATDATAEPLAFARLRPGADRAIFALADAYALPGALGRFEGAFAGLWLSHVPKRRLPEFLASLHARLEPGAVVVMIDNNEAQLAELPIAERDADGDTWQHRVLPDGSVHRVLKNFPSKAALEAMVGDLAAEFDYRALENFWALRYRLR